MSTSVEIRSSDPQGDWVNDNPSSIFDFNQIRLNQVTILYQNVSVIFETHLVGWLIRYTHALNEAAIHGRFKRSDIITISGDRVSFDATMADLVHVTVDDIQKGNTATISLIWSGALLCHELLVKYVRRAFNDKGVSFESLNDTNLLTLSIVNELHKP